MKVIHYTIISTLFFFLTINYSFSQDSLSFIKKRIREIQELSLKINMLEGSIGDGNGFEMVFCYTNQELHIYEYYDNQDNLLFETIIFDKGLPIYYEWIRTKDYYNRTKKALSFYKCYLKNGEIIKSVSKGKLPTKITAASIFKSASKAIETYKIICH